MLPGTYSTVPVTVPFSSYVNCRFALLDLLVESTILFKCHGASVQSNSKSCDANHSQRVWSFWSFFKHCHARHLAGCLQEAGTSHCLVRHVPLLNLDNQNNHMSDPSPSLRYDRHCSPHFPCGSGSCRVLMWKNSCCQSSPFRTLSLPLLRWIFALHSTPYFTSALTVKRQTKVVATNSSSPRARCRARRNRSSKFLHFRFPFCSPHLLNLLRAQTVLATSP